MISITVWIFLTIAVLAYFLLRPKKQSINLPGPWPIPFVGNLFEMEGRFFLTLDKWSKKYGPICKFQLGSMETVLVSDPVYTKEMLAMDAFIGRAFKEEFLLFEAKNIGLINSEGEMWEQQRRFVLRQLRDFGFGKSSLEPVIMEEVNDLTERLIAFKGKPISDIKNKLSLATVNALWSIVAGKRYSQDDVKLQELTRQLSGAFDEVAKSGAALAFIPWIKYIFPEMSGYKPIRRIMQGLVNFVSKEIKEHEDTYQEDNPRDFIDVYLTEVKKTKDPNSSFYKGDSSERQLISVVADLFQAGTDTISSTLNWSILYLLTQPEIQRKLQNEVKAVTGNSRPVSFSDRPNMPYTLAFINEVLRVAAPPFGVPHRTLFEVEYRGVTFPKDTAIMFNLHYIHNDPKLWGDPENFRPERFLSADEKTLKKIDYLNPFMIGRRQCPGETLARDKIFLILTNIMQKFNIVKDPDSEEPDLEPAVSFVVQPKPYKVIFQERKDL